MITEEHVKKARAKTEQDRVTDIIKTLPTQSKLVLYACIALFKSNEKEEDGDITTGDIYNKYRKYCNTVGMEILTQRWVTEMIDELAMLGMITCKVSSKGRYGRTRIIDQSVDPNHVKDVLLEDYRLEPFGH